MKLWIARDKQDYLGLYYEKPTWKKSNLSQVEDGMTVVFSDI